MARHNELGRKGEEAACFYLMERDIRLLERNWRFHHLEVDIIAEEYGEIIFIEVKSRRNEKFADAAAAVDKQKQLFLVRAAQAYLGKHGLTDAPYRFDIITLVGECEPFELTHYVNAFTTQTLNPPSHEQLFF